MTRCRRMRRFRLLPDFPGQGLRHFPAGRCLHRGSQRHSARHHRSSRTIPASPRFPCQRLRCRMRLPPQKIPLRLRKSRRPVRRRFRCPSSRSPSPEHHGVPHQSRERPGRRGQCARPLPYPRPGLFRLCQRPPEEMALPVRSRQPVRTDRRLRFRPSLRREPEPVPPLPPGVFPGNALPRL